MQSAAILQRPDVPMRTPYMYAVTVANTVTHPHPFNDLGVNGVINGVIGLFSCGFGMNAGIRGETR